MTERIRELLPAQWGSARKTVVWMLFGLIIFSLALYAFLPELRKDDVFKTLLTLMIGNGFIGIIVASYFSREMGGDANAPGASPLNPLHTEEVREAP